MIRSLALLMAVLLLASGARSFLPADATVTGTGAAFALGVVLLSALLVGKAFDAVKLPHLTGYLASGAILGPDVLGLVTPAMLGDLTLIKRVAVGLIALIAGCELDLRALRPRLASIGVLATIALACAALGLTAVSYLYVLPHIPATAHLEPMPRLVVAVLIANVLTALSPAVVIGILTETKSQGPLSEAALSIVVLADLAIVVAYAATGTLVDATFPTNTEASSALLELGVHLFGSMLAGAGLGVVIVVFARVVGKHTGLFVFAILFVVAEVGKVLHLDPLLTGLTAGLLIENASALAGEEVIRETAVASLPTFALFFAVVGAEVHLEAFAAMATLALLCAAVRAVGLTVGTRIARRVVKLDDALAARIPFAMFPQAGIALALASGVASSSWPWAEQVGSLLLGSILVNEAIGPVFFRMALERAGEIGRKDHHGVA